MIEDDEARTRKEMGGLNMLFRVTAPESAHESFKKKGTFIIESERFFDARAFGLRLFGLSEVVIERIDAQGATFPRWQVRWAGHAAGANTLRMQAREVKSERDAKSDRGWRDVRDLR